MELRTCSKSHFLSYIRFCQYISNFIRYIRTIVRFTKEEAEVRKQAHLFLPARYIQTSEAFSEQKKPFFGVSKLFEFFITS